MTDGVSSALHKAGRILRFLRRALKVAEPCCGIGGLRSWAIASGVPYNAFCACDFDESIDDFYGSLKKKGEPGLEDMACGEERGDVSHVDVHQLPACELLLSGPPCQPYAPNGKGEGFCDPRSEIFEIVVGWIIHLAWQGTLVAFLVENSTAIVSHEYFWKLIEQITCSCPFFRVEVVQQDLKCLMPHSRPRVWVRGLRVDCLESPSCPLPMPLAMTDVCKDTFHLKDFLDPSLQNHDPSKLTVTMRSNLALYKEIAREAIRSGETTGSVMSVELDRNPLRAYGGSVSFDTIPSLRTQGPKIFLVSLHDLEAPWHQQQIHRFLSVRERFLLQGHSATLADHFRTLSAATKASGNAFNVLQMACMVAPLLEAAARRKVLTQDGVQKLTSEQLCSLIGSDGPPPKPELQHLSAQPEGVVQQKRKRIKA